MAAVEVPIIFIERRAGQSKLSKGVVLEALLMPLKLRWHTQAMKRGMRELEYTGKGVIKRK